MGKINALLSGAFQALTGVYAPSLWSDKITSERELKDAYDRLLLLSASVRGGGDNVYTRLGARATDELADIQAGRRLPNSKGIDRLIAKIVVIRDNEVLGEKKK